MANIRLVALVLVVILLPFHPILAGNGFEAIASGQTLSRIFKICRRCFGPLGTLMDVFDFINKLIGGLSDQSKDNTAAPDAEPIGFYINFYVGTPKQPVTARMSISNKITLIENYQPSYSSTHQCCSAVLNCSVAICNGSYYVESDTFTFENSHIENVPYIQERGDIMQKTTGFLSFSRSTNSLLRIASDQVLSYLFSDQDSLSYFTLGSGAPTATTLQSTKLLANPNHRDLFFVKLAQITVGTNSFEIDPTTNSSTVILDTILTPTLLETSVYAKVKAELMKVRSDGRFKDKDNELEVCYKRKWPYNKPRWPDLTLSFPSSDPSNSSAVAQMVLTKKNYVVRIKTRRYNVDCAAIYETQGASVIGVMAQANRQMVFDLSSSEPRLYFSKYAFPVLSPV